MARYTRFGIEYLTLFHHFCNMFLPRFQYKNQNIDSCTSIRENIMKSSGKSDIIQCTIICKKVLPSMQQITLK
ncbi:DEHA2E23210p [Debaryomyces hansenii CBS767]|uniref:DEHA2E23210p n=1 Tax=Debaryomyces hansenii (strain ATCC 36239 / CBS 767 / BCRC 21394 / JCM 1990 / NBRC 0083 / IGC 2968) TaxID=284592 RepID=B5RU61_DEBHA|nr:DEHA2E23210p [Debaryomyces hansenii CBS767]CAR65873.1 DEHA2E23210p [Debaryomyces hansenii CBS767]|eukprot:XP_002770532.1 DEHA2E23210p [Debaryomyces hansenii CBS767]